MIEPERITSTQNAKIKHLLQLQQKSSLRRSEGLFVVEGMRELTHCVENGYDVDCIYCCETAIKDAGSLSAVGKNSRIISVSDNVYDRIALRGTTEGVVAVVKARKTRLSDLRLSDRPLIVVLESVEKPGNLGAVLRSADAANADALIVCDQLTDLYNPNIIRSSIGAIFSVPTVACTTDECIDFLRQNNIKILTAQLQDSKLYYDTDMTCPTAIVMGTESTGLTNKWREVANAHIRIPMLGQLDSLNVSVSAAILLFEAVRQRQTDEKK